MSWENELAKQFKQRDNPSIIGAVIGKVISPMPDLKVSILDGIVILQKEQLYITAGLKEKLYKTEIRGSKSGDIQIRTITYSQNEEILDDDFPKQRIKIVQETGTNQLYEITNLDMFDKENIKINLWFELKKGDEVLVIPSASEQQFFIVDIVEPVGGV